MSEFSSLRDAGNMVTHLQTVILYNVQVARREWSKELGINKYLDNSLKKELDETWIERYIGVEENDAASASASADDNIGN